MISLSSIQPYCSRHSFYSESSITSETSRSKGASFKCVGSFPYLPSVAWHCLAEVSLPFQQPLIHFSAEELVLRSPQLSSQGKFRLQKVNFPVLVLL